jgi:DNA-binding transcriptional regulator YhcF (GntR family)
VNSAGEDRTVIVGLDPQSPVPPYEQLRGQIAGAIARGELRAEERLPTVRQLAADLRLAVNTVARAYRELEAAGFVQSRGRNGSFVAGPPSETRRQAEAATHAYAERMRRLGLSHLEILATVRRELGDDNAGLSKQAVLRPRELS